MRLLLWLLLPLSGYCSDYKKVTVVYANSNLVKAAAKEASLALGKLVSVGNEAVRTELHMNNESMCNELKERAEKQKPAVIIWETAQDCKDMFSDNVFLLKVDVKNKTFVESDDTIIWDQDWDLFVREVLENAHFPQRHCISPWITFFLCLLILILFIGLVVSLGTVVFLVLRQKKSTHHEDEECQSSGKRSATMIRMKTMRSGEKSSKSSKSTRSKKGRISTDKSSKMTDTSSKSAKSNKSGKSAKSIKSLKSSKSSNNSSKSSKSSISSDGSGKSGKVSGKMDSVERFMTKSRRERSPTKFEKSERKKDTLKTEQASPAAQSTTSDVSSKTLNGMGTPVPKDSKEMNGKSGCDTTSVTLSREDAASMTGSMSAEPTGKSKEKTSNEQMGKMGGTGGFDTTVVVLSGEDAASMTGSMSAEPAAKSKETTSKEQMPITAGSSSVEHKSTTTAKTCVETTKAPHPTAPISAPSTLQCSLVNSPIRSVAEVIEQPMTSSEFIVHVDRLSRMAVQMTEKGEKPEPTGAEVRVLPLNRLPSSCPNNPEDFEAVTKDLRTLMNMVVHGSHPHNYSLGSTRNGFVDVLSSILARVVKDSGNVIKELESTTMNWLAKALSLPEAFVTKTNGLDGGGGISCTDYSQSLFISIVTAREVKIKQQSARLPSVQLESSEMELVHAVSKRLVVYVNKECCGPVEAACRLAQLKCRVIPSRDTDIEMKGADLEREVAKDIEKGLFPCMVVISMGSVGVGWSDEMESISVVAQKHNLSVHVDASYSGSFWVDQQFRGDCDHLAKADTISIDPFNTGDCVLFAKNLPAVREFAGKPGNTNYAECRALKLWAMMRLNGLQGLRRYANQMADLCGYFEELTRSNMSIRVFHQRNLGKFAFQYFEPDLSEMEINQYSTRLGLFLNVSGKLLFTNVQIGSHSVIMVKMSCERASKATIDDAYEILAGLVEQFKLRRDDVSLLSTRPASITNGPTGVVETDVTPKSTASAVSSIASPKKRQ